MALSYSWMVVTYIGYVYNTWYANLTFEYPETLYLSLIGIILRWGFLIWELIFYLLRTFSPHLGSFCVVSSFTTFRPNFTSGLLLPSGPVVQRIEALSLCGSRWALSEDSGFRSYPSWPEVYLVKNVVR